jgi:hypothetical protein
MNQPPDPKSRQQQFLVICTVMVAAFLHSFVMAGGFHSIHTSSGPFEGGEFCYKITSRDYATSMSLAENIGQDMGIKTRQNDDEHPNPLYTLYMDSPASLSADRLRFAVGHLALTADSKRINREVLMKKNKDIVVPLSTKELNDLAVTEIWSRLVYKTVQLPRMKQALVTHLPFNDGFLSALLFTYKIMPSLLTQAKEAGMRGPIVVMSTCSVRDAMCTHYALSGKVFLLGQPETETYAANVKATSLLPWHHIQKTLLKPLVWSGIVNDEL